MTNINTTKKGNVTIKNFGKNKGAAINYYNNIKNKSYVSFVGCGFNAKEKGYCVEIIYR